MTDAEALFICTERQANSGETQPRERAPAVSASPERAVFTQAGLNNVLTAQVQDKLTGESRREGCKTDVDNLL